MNTQKWSTLWIAGQSILLLAIAAFVLIPTPSQAQFVYSNFSQTSGLSLVGNATVVSNKTLRLTGTAFAERGAVWYTTAQNVEGGFTSTFQFQMTNLGGYPGWGPGADGITFVIQNDPAGIKAIGGAGRDIGYGGIASSVAVEFDTFKNPEYGDPNNNHISVHTNGTGINGAGSAYSLGDNSHLPFVMADGKVHTAQIAYVPGTLSVIVDNHPILSVSVDLQTKLALPAGKAIVGLTAATGNAWEDQDILNWSMTVSQTQKQTLFVSDNVDSKIYQVTAPSTATLFANVNFPKALAFDSKGDLFEVDNGSGRILEFPATGSSRVFASNLSNPWGLAFDSKGNLYVSDRGANCIYKYTPTGTRTTFVVKLNSPTGLACDKQDNLYEADAGSGQIYKITAAAVVSRFATGLNGPYGLAFDSAGYLYEADNGTGRILVFAPNGTSRVFASGVNGPRGLAFDRSGNLYEADSVTNTVYKFTTTGVASKYVTLNDPVGLAFNNN